MKHLMKLESFIEKAFESEEPIKYAILYDTYNEDPATWHNYYGIIVDTGFNLGFKDANNRLV